MNFAGILGVYVSFLIDPPQSPHYKYTKDYVVVLSDWSNTDPEKILKNLKNCFMLITQFDRIQSGKILNRHKLTPVLQIQL